MKKVLALSAVAAAMGLFAMSASALPTGYESVNFRGTLNIQNGEKIKQVSVSNKDILGLIANQFVTLPSGAQLVYRGLYYSEGFTVLSKNNSVLISNASTGSGSYELELIYSESGDWTYTYSSPVENYQSYSASLIYSDYYGDNYFTINGTGKDTVNWDSYNESYSISNLSGWFYLPMLGIGSDAGIINGSVSGSGKDIYPFDY